MTKTGLIAPIGFEQELEVELSMKKIDIIQKKGRVFVVGECNVPVIWAQLRLQNLQVLDIASIGDAGKKLKAMARLWTLVSVEHHRRAQLIQESLPFIKKKEIEFMAQLPAQSLAVWTLIEENKILYSLETNVLYPIGEIEFKENKVDPPSRAYLKLWEFFTLNRITPKEDDIVIDVGSCPGGWTWVLHELNASIVHSVDKAPLELDLKKYNRVQFKSESAFGLNPHDFPGLTWFFSDIICYPPRLLTLVKKFMEVYPDLKFVCTIKYQKVTDWDTTNKFLEIPGSKIIHLHHNKHEVTWYKI
jgi:23S rRNA (cytidine2498-2'-O)-methyltransferase